MVALQENKVLPTDCVCQHYLSLFGSGTGSFVSVGLCWWLFKKRVKWSNSSFKPRPYIRNFHTYFSFFLTNHPFTNSC